MATEPSSLPRWATDGAAGIVEPSSGKKDLGFDPGERPPAQYFDWLFNLIYLWIYWLAKGPWELSISPFSAVANSVDVSPRYEGYLRDDSSAAKNIFYPIAIPVGNTITGYVINRYGNGTVDFTYRVVVVAADGTATEVTNDSESNVSAAWGQYTKALSVTIDDGETVFFEITSTSSPDLSRYGALIISHERP